MPAQFPLSRAVGEIAAAEKSGKGVSGDIASFWWDYEPEEQYATDAVKRHAVEFYKKALADGSISGLKKTLAEKRVASLGPVVESGAAAAAAAPASEPAKPAVAEIKPEPKRTEVASKPAPAVPASAKGGRWTLPKTFQTPLERSLDLGGGVTMTFCACPAGSFTMLDHKVTITRPFWISKTVVSMQQLLTFPGWNGFDRLRRKDLVDKVMRESALKDNFKTVPIRYGEICTYTDWMTKKYRGILPPGYVFRMPSEAELCYAYGAGADEDRVNVSVCCDDFTITGNALANLGWTPKLDYYDWGSFPKEYFWLRFMSLPTQNSFGVVPIVAKNSAQFVFDRINTELRDNVNEVSGLNSIKALMRYEAEEVDPLRLGSASLITRGALPRTAIVVICNAWHAANFMVVIGPDLEAEKKAAKK